MCASEKQSFRPEDILQFRNASDPQLSPDGTRVAWVQTHIDDIRNRYVSQLMLTDVNSGDTQCLTPDGHSDTAPRFSPNGHFIACLSVSHTPVEQPSPIAFLNGPAQVHVLSVENHRRRPVTDLRAGVTDLTWSPTGEAFALSVPVDPDRGLELLAEDTQDDEGLYERYNRDVLRIKRMQWKADGLGFLGNYVPQVVLLPFDPSGATSPQPHLLTEGPRGLHGPVWSPDGEFLAVTGDLRPQGEAVRQSFVYRLPATPSGPHTPEVLFSLEEMRSTDLAWSPDGQQLACFGHNDPALGHYGLQRVWVYSFAEDRLQCVTSDIDLTFGDYSRDADVVVRRGSAGNDGPMWLSDSQTLLVLSNEAGQTRLNRLSIDSRVLEPVDLPYHVLNGFCVDAAGERAVVLACDAVEPGDLYYVSLTEATELKRLTAVNLEILAARSVAPLHTFTFESDDTSILAWLVQPLGASAAEPAPLLIYNGGGAGGMRCGLFNFQAQVLAAAGYAVLHCNTRGNHGHGEAFSAVSRGRWGSEDYQDNMAGIAAARDEFDFVDPDRLGAYGASYGGYMTNWMIARHPEFNAAVSVNCLYNRFSFNGTGDMSYLLDQVEFDRQPPWEAADRYWERSPMQYVAGTQTPTLVIHAGNDHRCPVDQGESFFNHLQTLGVPSEFVRIGDDSHGIRAPWHRVLRHRVMIEWFNRWMQ